MKRILARTGFRYLQRHPLQLVLAVGGVGLGVAVAVSVALATDAAKRAFTLTNNQLVGSATHQIVAGSAGLPDNLYRRLRVELGLRAAVPIVEGFVTLQSDPPRTLRVVGVDPLAEGTFRRQFGATPAGGEFRLEDLLVRPRGVVALGAGAAAVGEVLAVRADGRTERLEVVARARPDEPALADALLADIATAQEVLGRRGRLTRIDLELGPDDAELAAAIRSVLPGTARLVDAKARADTTVQMTQAFELNLRAMSLLAMLCGLFLIYNTMTFSVVQRREQFGALRALGVTRSEILRLVLGEAFVVGLAGTALGGVGGVWLGSGLVRLVTRTINDLYFVVSVREVAIAPATVALAVLLGVGGTLLAALVPAREATRVTPRSALTRSAVEERATAAAPRLAQVGGASLVAGFALAIWPAGGLVGAFGGLLLVVIGAALATPLAVRTVAAVGGATLGRFFGPPARVAARAVGAGLSRTAVAVAALAIAVAVLVGVGVMVTSFRTTLVNWLGHTLQADLYVSPASAAGEAAILRLTPAQRAAIAATPGVVRTRAIRVVRLETTPESTMLLAVEHSAPDRAAYRLRDPVAAAAVEEAWRRFANGAVMVSEPFSVRRGVGTDDTILLPTPAGDRRFEIAGVYYSYASDRGAAMLRRDEYVRHWGDDQVTGLSIYLEDPEQTRAVAGAVASALSPRAVSVVSNRDLRERSMAVFDRTFRITGVLRILVTLVAFIGVLGAILALQLERSREHGLLRATGFTPGQLWQTVSWQSGLVGATAGAIALPLGWLLAWLMIHVINKRSFGWTLEMVVPSSVLMQAFAVAMAAALLAGLYPAARIARTPPVVVMRED